MSRFNWAHWTRKLSTLVAAAAVSAGGIAAAVLAYYSGLPAAVQASWPFWLPPALALFPGVVAALGPFAVAFRQAVFDESPTEESENA